MARTARFADPPDNIVQAVLERGELERKLVLNASEGRGTISIRELTDDTNVITIEGGERIPGKPDALAVTLDATRLWALVVGTASLFGGRAYTRAQARETEAELLDKVRDVLIRNESRCLDDDIDREVVLRDLMKALL